MSNSRSAKQVLVKQLSVLLVSLKDLRREFGHGAHAFYIHNGQFISMCGIQDGSGIPQHWHIVLLQHAQKLWFFFSSMAGNVVG
jgi:hypothetical protein